MFLQRFSHHQKTQNQKAIVRFINVETIQRTTLETTPRYGIVISSQNADKYIVTKTMIVISIEFITNHTFVLLVMLFIVKLLHQFQ